MGICEGCTVEFPSLDAPHCGRCTKLLDCPQPVTSDVRKGIAEEPQCEVCGCVYLFLTEKVCGSCRRTVANYDDDDTRRALVESRVADFSQRASTHRLYRAQARAQNASLQSASEHRMKTAALRKTAKAEMVTVCATLWSLSRQGAASRKLLPLTITMVFNAEHNADDMLTEMVVKVKESYDENPATRELLNPGPRPSFERSLVQFGVVKTASNVSELNPKTISDMKVGALLTYLARNNLLSLKDNKDKRLSLRILVVEPVPETDDEDTDFEVTPRRSKRKSTACSSTVSPPSKRYRSTFRPLITMSSFSLQYDSYKFKRITYMVDEEGESTQVVGAIPETVLVAQDWQLHKQGDRPEGGYISKGFSKFAFHGRVGMMDYAILQSKPILSCESMNHQDLLDELELLSLGKFFLDSFYRRADIYKVTRRLPKIKWNVDGAFVGLLEDPLPPVPTNSTDNDNRSLVFSTFLATPLLPSGPSFKEEKFSGNSDVGNNSGRVGEAIDAFAHHVVVDSSHTVLFADLQGVIGLDDTVILFDPQAHTATEKAGHWDKGHTAIQDFLRMHKCNKICRAMELHKDASATTTPADVSPTWHHPLRIGF